jgi:hypothetical protein
MLIYQLFDLCIFDWFLYYKLLFLLNLHDFLLKILYVKNFGFNMNFFEYLILYHFLFFLISKRFLEEIFIYQKKLHFYMIMKIIAINYFLVNYCYY